MTHPEGPRMNPIEKLSWATTSLLFATIICFVLAFVWTGDTRYGWTGLVLLAPLVIAFVAAAAMAGIRKPR